VDAFGCTPGVRPNTLAALSAEITDVLPATVAPTLADALCRPEMRRSGMTAAMANHATE
jgi:hypothetical protein